MTWGPTPAGWALIGCTITCAGLGLALPRPELVTAAVTGAASLLLTAALVAAAPPARAERDDVRDLRAGQRATLRVRVPRARGPRTWFLLTDLLDRVGDAHARVRALPQTEYPVTPGRRGPADLGPLRVRHTDVLGLWQRTRCAVPAGQVLIHPRLVGVPAPGRVSGGGGGGGAGTGSRDGQASGVRAYRDGDERRSVHWLSSARTGSLMVRQYAGGTTGVLHLCLVTSATEYPDPEDFETAVALTAGILLACLAEPMPCLFTTTGGLRIHGDGPADRQRLLDAVAQVRLDGSAPRPDGAAAANAPLAVVRGTRSPGDGHTLTLPVSAGAGGLDGAVAAWRVWCLDRWQA